MARLEDVPDPLIFGPAFPELRLVMRGGRQKVESTSNDLLGTGKTAFTAEGTLTFAKLLKDLHACREAHRECWNLCPLVCHVANPEIGEEWGIYSTGLDTDRCPGLKRLCAHCQTEPQKRFFDLWLSLHTRGKRIENVGPSSEYGDPITYSHYALEAWCDFPALVPEVWLNYLGPKKDADDELHLAENPSRVDFVLLAEGRKCVIEIDGKSHYADYDRATNRWTPDERRYTRNLRIERSLRSQGWEIHRFSDFEVKTATEATFARMVSLLPTGAVPF